jgi:hypothetical protein
VCLGPSTQQGLIFPSAFSTDGKIAVLPCAFVLATAIKNLVPPQNVFIPFFHIFFYEENHYIAIVHLEKVRHLIKEVFLKFQSKYYMCFLFSIKYKRHSCETHSYIHVLYTKLFLLSTYNMWYFMLQFCTFWYFFNI